MNILQSMKRNKHTSAAAVVGFALQAAAVLWPEFKPKADELFKLAIIYGFALAGDGSPKSQGDDDKQGKLRFPAILICLSLLGFGLLTQGCNTPTNGAAAAFHTLDDLRAVVDGAERVYGRAVVAGKVSQTDQAKIDDSIRQFHAAYLVAVRAARLDGTAPASQDLTKLADSLVALIYTFAKEPAP